MAEYISKEAVLQKFLERGSGYIDMLTMKTMVDEMPASDVQPVKHGYWEEVTDYGGWGDTHYRCSVCGEEWYLEDGTPKDNNMNGCPRCLAKMDAEPDEPWQSE